MGIVSIQNKLKQWNWDITWSRSLTFGKGVGLKVQTSHAEIVFTIYVT